MLFEPAVCPWTCERCTWLLCLLTEQGVERLLVVDWDVAHGNGTQQMFLGDNRVLFVSMHTQDTRCSGEQGVSRTNAARPNIV